jgi:hypothetical protein
MPAKRTARKDTVKKRVVLIQKFNAQNCDLMEDFCV